MKPGIFLTFGRDSAEFFTIWFTDGKKDKMLRAGIVDRREAHRI